MSGIQIADKNGHIRYHRPFVILTPNDEIDVSDDLFGVVASNTAANLKPRPPFCVELPYHPSGRVFTKLRKPTLAMCGWIASVKMGDIETQNIGGLVPPAIVERILKIRAMMPL